MALYTHYSLQLFTMWDNNIQHPPQTQAKKWKLDNTQGFDTLLKSNEPNSISKDALRDEGCLWLINCTTQKYLVNVGLDSYFNIPPHVWLTNQRRGP